MERLALQRISSFIRSPPIFSSSDKVSALIGELRRLGAYEALIESGSKPKLITLLDLLKAPDPERTSIGKIARSAVPINFEAPILEAADLMIMNEAWSLIAKRGDEVLGVISQLDIVSALSKRHLLQ
ncbi:MAG: CBS domain-containing protein, partial [Thaumarchaeota archaeon]|nr:CBS domain-containing protein [Nitrososphaerota archaeon]